MTVPCSRSPMPNPITLTQNAKLLPCKTFTLQTALGGLSRSLHHAPSDLQRCHLRLAHLLLLHRGALAPQ